MDIQSMAAWVPISREALEDAPFVAAKVERFMWQVELAIRGFLGIVRCARCHRRTRCVYTIGGRLYGRNCAGILEVAA